MVDGVLLGVTLILAAWLLTQVVDPDGEGASGTGLTYRGEFYLLSDAEVRPDRLGEVLERDVAFQDTTTVVRLITDMSPEVAVAALLPRHDGRGDEARQTWLLLSPQPGLAADPWSEAGLSDAVHPHP